MTIKRIIYRSFIRLLEQMLMFHSFQKCYRSNLSIDKLPDENEFCDIITVAFNNEQIIEYQIKLIRKYIQGDFNYIVADNSSNEQISQKIRILCEINKVSYVKLPQNHLNLIGPSYSHSASLNWIYRKIIEKRKPCYFGFIDHDLFPIKFISIKDKLKNQPIYGPLRKRGDKYWYLWAGLCFFRFSLTKNKKIDFLPVTPEKDYLDSGGGNWFSLYSRLQLDSLSFVSERMKNIKEGDCRHGDKIEFFDDCWLHSINGSYWKKVESKENIIEQILKEYY